MKRLGAGSARVGAAVTERVLRWRLLQAFWRRQFGVAVAMARLLRRLDRRTDSRIDTSRAGRALLRAVPEANERLAARLPGGCVLVSATNGKTTTTTMLAAIARAAGLDPVVNHVGANMAGGICAELIGRSGRRRSAPDIGIFEVDELWLDQLVGPLAPQVIALGNLFRDQLDRMGELDRVTARWQALVEQLPETTTLVVTADDPRVCQLTAAHPRVVFTGLGDTWRGRPTSGTDVPDCAGCGGVLDYDGAHIGHLGQWRCTGCGRRRPQPAVEASDLRLRGLDGAEFTLACSTGNRRVSIGIPGRFNVANAVQAAGAALTLGIEVDSVVAGLQSATGAFGRAERITIDGCEVTLLLAKNPSGLDEIVTMLATGTSIDLVFLLNDAGMDGHDVSWIWDADLECLAAHIVTVTCGGSRSAEAALRLDYAGVPPDRIGAVENISGALDLALRRHPGSGVVVIANYSAMLDLRETIAEQGHAERYWR